MPLRRLCVPFVLALAFVSAGPALAAPKSAATAPASADDLVWRGDHATGRALMEDLAKEYAKQKKGRIVLQQFSTLSGLDAVVQGSADFAGSARGKYARRSEEASLNFIPVALDGAVLITHPKNPVSSLTLKQVHDIYYGRIKNWKELGGEDKEINLYAIASPLDGVEYSLRELVFRNGDQRVAAPRLYINTVKLEEGITLDPAGLGLSTLANASANKGVKMLGVEGVAPSLATIGDGSYPLYITLYLAERSDSPKQAAIERFLAFLDTPAAKDILRRHQLIPYADAGAMTEKNAQRMAFIDAKVGRDAGSAAAATLAASAPPPTPVSAPRATVEAAARIAPTSATAQAARENLARAEAKKAEAPKAVAAAPKKAPAKTVAKAAPAKKAPAKDAKPKTATAKAAAPAAQKKPVSFGNVSGGSAGG